MVNLGSEAKTALDVGIKRKNLTGSSAILWVVEEILCDCRNIFKIYTQFLTRILF